MGIDLEFKPIYFGAGIFPKVTAANYRELVYKKPTCIVFHGFGYKPS